MQSQWPLPQQKRSQPRALASGPAAAAVTQPPAPAPACPLRGPYMDFKNILESTWIQPVLGPRLTSLSPSSEDELLLRGPPAGSRWKLACCRSAPAACTVGGWAGGWVAGWAQARAQA